MSDAPGRARAGPIALALASVALAWVPLLGLVLAGAALLLVRAARRSGRATGPALAIAVLGAVLSAAATGAFLACSPSRQTPQEERAWREFDRLFEPRTAPIPENPQENPEETPGRGGARP